MEISLYNKVQNTHQFYYFLVFREVKILANDALKVSDLKIFDNFTQSDTNDCSNTACPGLLLSTPQKCHCTCGDGFSLNASGIKCIPQINSTAVPTCATGK